jgi:hypothetical protein
MERSETRAGPQGPEARGDEWLGDYLSRVTDYWQRTSRAGAVLASRWGDRSLQQDTWTADTVTADVIEAWEELTPLTGEGLELVIELMRQAMQVGRSDA